MRRGPQGLDAVHGGAIADHRHHRTLRQSQLHADGAGDAPADTPAGQAVVPLAFPHAQQAQQGAG